MKNVTSTSWEQHIELNIKLHQTNKKSWRISPTGGQWHKSKRQMLLYVLIVTADMLSLFGGWDNNDKQQMPIKRANYEMTFERLCLRRNLCTPKNSSPVCWSIHFIFFRVTLFITRFAPSLHCKEIHQFQCRYQRCISRTELGSGSWFTSGIIIERTDEGSNQVSLSFKYERLCSSLLTYNFTIYPC